MSVVDSLIFSFVISIEASEFEVQFFLRGVECDTQFAKKRSWSLFFLSFFSLSGGALLGFGIFGKHSLVNSRILVDSCAGVRSWRVNELGRGSRSGPLVPP